MEIHQSIASQYQVKKAIGQGQFGKVFAAIDLNTQELVAIKEIAYHSSSTHKFLREINFLVSLQHPNIVGCRAIKNTKSARYLVMDYCQEGNLREWLNRKKNINLEQALQITSDILFGLEYAHSKGIVHCDLKPENILFSQDAARQKAIISDFGIARLINEERPELIGVTGSPAYMAPERFYGKYSRCSDLYAVGVMLFEMITGDRPFSGLPGKLMIAHLNAPIEVPSTIPFLVRKTIVKALEKLPQKRFQTATEMLESIYLTAEIEKPSVDTELRSHFMDFDNLF